MKTVKIKLDKKPYEILKHASKVSKLSVSTIVNSLLVVDHLNRLGLLKFPKVKKK